MNHGEVLAENSQTGLLKDKVLRVSDLSWQAGHKQVLDKLSFNLEAGTMLGLIGPNGAGKSSLLRCLYRFIKASDGQIELFGRDLGQYSSRELAKLIAVVQQEAQGSAEFAMSTVQVVSLGLTPHKGLFDGLTSEDKQRVDQALAKVGLETQAEQAFSQLSGGEKQRALIARAIVQQPKLLILDEPTNHLDIRYQIQILELVKSLGISVMASIHDLNLASALCDKLLLIHQGRLVAQGRPDEVLTPARISEVFGVCCDIRPHPQHGQPLISYFYGYNASAHALSTATAHLIGAERAAKRAGGFDGAEQ
ncbi:ABC transporter related [Shewanella denitrificans OS217]|jgi:iron complex transport system ATP-binding protein|uniref:ABC transporter related n=1 Tax=Shewanella denitrificans (strain OS217 / ATCC BAA-1090 / DSM 15013) TaxID=318161 RepID=Q12Q72_SHEDO|nr:ABC transporter ATP-binding protein [Shewanella denitrificans]ABE54404.1 ABC transporter related [Shewanella denitrificans OS217]